MLIDLLSNTSGIDRDKLISLSLTANRRYKVYEIPKRTGGVRKIEHPSRDLKSIQRWLVRALFDRLPIHEMATAYQEGSSIRRNAEFHRRSRYTNRYDFASFFPSFTQARVEAFLSAWRTKFDFPITDEDIRFVGNITCRFGRLTIGAPSSPKITNAMMHPFDVHMHEHCSTLGLVYTRYADDIFVSSREPDMMVKIEDEIRTAKREAPHISLRLNREKTVYLSRKFNRTITGVTITPSETLSIGRDRKREIKSLVHRWMQGSLDRDRVAYLRGILAFARDVEPEFETRLRRKYGDHAIDEILHNPEITEAFID